MSAHEGLGIHVVFTTNADGEIRLLGGPYTSESEAKDFAERCKKSPIYDIETARPAEIGVGQFAHAPMPKED